ncbi:MAG: hypothetical protein AAB554_03805 [Patescibacteria group bacterium]
MDIKVILDRMPDLFPKTDQNYPGIEGLAEGWRTVFMRKHVLLHFSKQAGLMAGILEQADHSGRHVFDCDAKNAMLDIVCKMLVNAFSLAAAEGFSAKQITQRLEELFPKLAEEPHAP